MKIERHKHFKKDMANAKLSDTQFDRFVRYISILANSEILPPEATDHALIGNYQGFREFHIGGDMLVIYFIEGDILVLARIGTHSQLF